MWLENVYRRSSTGPTILFLGLALLLFLAFGCASPRVRTFDPDMCGGQRGYEAGYNDGVEGYTMDSAFLSRCREDLREKAQQGYRDGFQKGHTEYEAKIAAYREQQAQSQSSASQPSGPVNNGTQIVVNVGGSGSDRGEDKAWFCEVSAFTHKYQGWGRTQLEAGNAAKVACGAQYHPMHCQYPSCQLNR